MMIGIERVNCIRIGITRPPVATMTSGFNSTRLAALARTSSILSVVQRSSNWTLNPTAQPRFRSSSRKARTRACISAFVGGNGIRIPILRTRSPCWARAASGHATAVPPSSVMNSRRLMPGMGAPSQVPRADLTS